MTDSDDAVTSYQRGLARAQRPDLARSSHMKPPIMDSDDKPPTTDFDDAIERDLDAADRAHAGMELPVTDSDAINRQLDSAGRAHSNRELPMRDSDAAIAHYLRELDSADLARSDLAEIEDHLRTLAAELRNSGLPALDAVAEAARRLGDPRAVAREHARVRTAFGTRLSALRTYSAALLITPMLIGVVIRAVEHGSLLSHIGAQLALCTIVTLALVFRLAWARPILIGGLAFYTLQAVFWAPSTPADLPWLLGNIGALAFVMPWHRRELTPAGWSLVLSVWAYATATLCMYFQYSTLDGRPLWIAPAGLLAMAAGTIATTGGILRARWAAPACMISVGALAIAFIEMWPLHESATRPILFGYFVVYALASGLLAAIVGAVMAWRTARSTLGTFRYVLR